MCKSVIVVVLLLALQVNRSLQQHQHDYTTPVPILKQIDRHNDDGSYTYGYEAADKSFKIETKYANGEVYGKYGYVDDQGTVREIEYGASKRGFEPAGSDINVPPPTLSNSNPYPLGPNEVDDGQYREDPSIYYKDQKFNRPAAPASRFSLNNPAPQKQQLQQSYYNPGPRYYNPQPAAPQPQSYYTPQPAAPQPQYYQPRAYQPPAAPRPQYNHYDPYNGAPQQHHPALKSLDLNTGSYSIDYTGRRK